MATALMTDWYATHGLSSRATCRQAQLDLAAENPLVYSLEGDLAMPSVPFHLRFPDRFRQLGIAEQDLVGAAVGMAMRGKIPFVNSFAGFLALRACEQIRLDVGYARANVKLAGSYTGISGGAAGPTHHCEVDIAVLRAIPNMVILSPADSWETYQATLAAAAYDGPVYIRVGRAETAAVYSDDLRPATFEIGKAVQLLDGRDLTIIATGNQVVWEALQAARRLADQGIQARVLNIHTIKPLDEAAILAAARETGAILTVEEHNHHGGLGAAVAQLVLGHHPVPVHRIGIQDRFCSVVGPYEEMLPVYGLDSLTIQRAAESLLRLRR